MSSLKTNLGKLSLKNPVTVASGTFGYEFDEYFNLSHLGAIVTKTITKFPKEGNPTPRLYETQAGMLNSIGLQNPGLDSFIENYLPLYKNYKSPLIVSFSGSTIAEFSEILVALDKQNGISGYEVNISCPNVENEGIAFGVDAKVVYDLTHALSKLTNRELIIKLSPNVTDIISIAKAAEEGGADSLALINTMLGMAIDWKTGRSRIARGVAGYSGPAIKPIALQMVYRVAKNTNIPILAMGGICTWQDAIEFIYAGASAIAIGTQNFVNPLSCMQVLQGLKNYFKKQNCSIDDIKGKVSGIT